MSRGRLSMSSAIKEASNYGSIWGRGTSWTVCVPWRSDNPSGPVTEINVDSYRKALTLRTSSRACIALHLMDKLDFESSAAIGEILYGCWLRAEVARDLRSVVREAAKHYHNGD